MKKILAVLIAFVLFTSLSLPQSLEASPQNLEPAQNLQTSDPEEFDFYITLGTLPTLYAGLTAFSSTYESYMWYERKQTFNSALFPENIQFLSLTDPYGEAMLTTIENKIRELHAAHPEAKFHLYTDDLRIQFGFQLFLANGIPESQYEVTLLSDGTGTYNTFKKLYSNLNSIDIWNQYANDYDSRKNRIVNGETNVISRTNNMDLTNSMYYASQSSNIEYKMQFPELLISQDPLVQTEVGKMNTIKIAPYNLFSELTDEQKSSFVEAVGIDKSMFDQLFDASPKPNLIISGTSLPGEGGTFEDVIEQIVKDYGNDYDLFFKPHPVWNPTTQPDLIKLGRKEFLDSKGITLLPAQLPMETLMWAYPDVKIGGYSSSLYMSTAKEQTVFFITDSIASMPAPLPDLYNLGYFGNAKTYPITPPKDSNADLADLQLSSEGTSIPLSVTDSVYKATLSNNQDSIILTVKPSSKYAAVSASKSGEQLALTGSKGIYQTGPIALPVGETKIDLTVKSTDGQVQKSYEVLLNREEDSSTGGEEPSGNTNLADMYLLSDSAIPLTVTDSVYKAEVANQVNSLKVVVKPEDKQASVSISQEGTDLEVSKKEDGYESAEVPLTQGENLFEVAVTSTNGKETAIYSLVVLRNQDNGGSGNGNGSGTGTGLGSGGNSTSGSQFEVILGNATQPIVPLVTEDHRLKLDLTKVPDSSGLQFDVSALLSYMEKEQVTSLVIENKELKYQIPIDLDKVIPNYNLLKKKTQDPIYAELSFKKSELSKEMKGSLNQSSVISDPYEISFALFTKSGERESVKEFRDYVTISLKMGKDFNGVDKSNIAAIAFADESGKTSVKPVKWTEQGGQWFADISTLTHSTFVLVRNERSFTDISKNYWASPSITEAANRLFVNGVGNGKFMPENKVTRAEFTSMVVRALGLPNYSVTNEEAAAFKDVRETSWYYTDIVSAQKAGLLGWATGANFYPNRTITRGEMAQLLYFVAESLGTDLQKATAEEMKSFKDFSGLTEAEQAAFSWTVKNGVSQGIRSNDGFLLKSNGDGTRAQAVALVLRTLRALSLIN